MAIAQAMCVPWSSEVTFLLGGAMASTGLSAAHHLNLVLVIILGIVGEVIGSSIAYFVGRKGGRPLVSRWGRYVLLTENDLNRAERFLVGHGGWAVPVARMLPLVRAFAGLVSGIVDIPPARFTVLNSIGTAVYVIVLTTIGHSLGGEWAKVNKSLSKVTDIVVVLVVLAVIAFVVLRLREFKKEKAEREARDQTGPNGSGFPGPDGRGYSAQDGGFGTQGGFGAQGGQHPGYQNGGGQYPPGGQPRQQPPAGYDRYGR
ncbi:MAG: DedA family protein [Streptosporangiales bacterium]|nr:DedA family protein [Streptosporangiales bacterium]